jgi:Bacterial extracellular solute-binding protein
MSVQLGFGGDAGGKGLTSLFRSLILLLFVSGLAAFFLINPAKWLPSQIPELLLVRVNATPDLQAWLEDARRRFLANSPRVAGRPLSLSIDYEEDTVASKGIVERLQQGATPASAPSTDGVWLTSRTAVQLMETTHRTQVSDKALHALASTMLTVIMWAPRARDVLPAAMAVPSRSQPLSWNDVDISWVAWHNLSIRPAVGSLSQQAPVRWAIPHPLRSAAGLASLMLMSLGDAGPQSVRWPDEPAEQQLLPWLSDFLRTVHRFRPSARETADDFIKYGPAQADVALLPEHLALEVLAHAAERPGPGGVVLYPRVNIAYEHGCIEVSGAGAQPLQREAFAGFRHYLRSEEGQRLGLAHGLRSTLADLTPRPMDPWQRFNAQGAQYTPQVIWTDVRAIVEPASRLATRVMERLDRP